MDQNVEDVRAAIARADWPRVKALLHPLLLVGAGVLVFAVDVWTWLLVRGDRRLTHSP
ncbi:hypothetical protein SAMN05421812_11673 [Asanoa hainanensis]|uniref:Uncharacterized protein n=1 Tax=Asanoa hainanensis TaxID=560556 RepID=A0A239PA39_9ACTN|nr:hypothetical protein [Asanoa hainanensis]SNT64026.1 hypothetical protein SAMN05421812_11673 [Asanoa hainanensis]